MSQQATREQWRTKTGFIVAAIGSAIGLGNIWRFPYAVYSNGGGAFLIPYFIALATAGIPILILEFTLGHRYRGSAPPTYKGLGRRWEWLGWWQVLVSFVVVTYYMIIVGWALSYTVYSFGTQWGDDTESFFYNNYLGFTGTSFWDPSGIQWKVLLAAVIVWALAYWVMRRGVRRGLEVTAMVLMPVLVVMIAIVVVRAVTLPGAVQGLDILLTPDLSALADPQVWIAAYGQVFFTLSIAFGIMMAYASYLPRRTDLSNSAFIAALSNCGFSLLIAIGIFGVLGFLAVQQGVSVNDVAAGGIGLAFVALPQVINELPALNSLFGVLFFGSVLFGAFTSAVSILEACVAGIRDKFALNRTNAVNWVCGLGFVASLLYVTNGGLAFLDVIDHFMTSYGLALSGFIEILLVAWIVRELSNLRRHTDQLSNFRVGAWWMVSLRYITPIGLGVTIAYSFYREFGKPYGDYPTSGLVTMGWCLAAGIVILAFVIQARKWRTTTEEARR